MIVVYIAHFAGTLIGVFIFSRIILRLLKKVEPPKTRLIVAYIILLSLNGILGGMGAADGGAFAPIEAIIQNIPALLCWIAYDIWHLKKTGNLKGRLY